MSRAGEPAHQRRTATPAGRLVAVVGPSGAGKDTLMAAARAHLPAAAGIRFVRRCITRPAGSGGEDHEALTPEAFLARRHSGGFALWWEAHGLFYAIPRDIEADLAAGRVVVANLSRTVLADATARYPLLVLEINAPPGALAARLAARGREDATTVAARLARQAPLPAGLAVHRVMNDGTVAAGAAAVAAVLLEALRQRPGIG